MDRAGSIFLQALYMEYLIENHLIDFPHGDIRIAKGDGYQYGEDQKRQQCRRHQQIP